MTRAIQRVEATRILKVDKGSLRVVQAGGTQTRVVQAATQQGLPGPPGNFELPAGDNFADIFEQALT